MRRLSRPTRAILIASVVIALAWPTLFPELFTKVGFLVSISHAAVLLCCILAVLGGWRRVRQTLSRPARAALIIGLAIVVVWSWADSVVTQAGSAGLSRSGDDLFVWTFCIAAGSCCTLVILTIACRMGRPLGRYVPRIRKATATALLALAIQVLSMGTIQTLYRRAGYSSFYIDDIHPRLGAWFFGGMENRPAATYRFEFDLLQITCLFDTPARQHEWWGWHLFFSLQEGGWPIKAIRESTARPTDLPLDSVILLSYEDIRQEANGRFIQISAHFTIPAVLLSISPLLFLRRWMRQHRQDQRRRKGLCATCGYDLAGNVSGVCPECGLLINPAASAASRAEGTSAASPT